MTGGAATAQPSSFKPSSFSVADIERRGNETLDGILPYFTEGLTKMLVTKPSDIYGYLGMIYYVVRANREP